MWWHEDFGTHQELKLECCIKNNMDSVIALTDKDLEIIGEQIAKMWLATQGFAADYLQDDNGSSEDPDYLDEDVYDY